MRARRLAYRIAVAACTLPALALTTARLTDPSGRVGVALVAITPFGLALYAAALLLVVVGLVRRRSLVLGAVGLVVAAGLGLHGWWYAPQVSGAEPPPAPGAEPVVVMTANLLFGTADGAALVDAAEEAGVDLLVVSEITESRLAAMDAAGLAELLPYRVGEPAPDEESYGTMAFSRDPVSGDAPLDTSQDGWMFRTDGLLVAAIHAMSPSDPGLWAADHAAIRAAVSAADPDLVVGDFNATADHLPMRRLADAGYRDAGELANVGWDPTWPTMRSGRVPGIPFAQIDHVLLGPRLAALDMRTVGVPGSDHLAVVAEIARR